MWIIQEPKRKHYEIKGILKRKTESMLQVCVCVCVCVFVCLFVCACVWNFAANLVNILQRHLNYLTKHTGRTEWAECRTKNKARMSRSKIKVLLVVFFFWLERHCPSWICTTWSDGKQTVVLGSFSAFEGWSAQEEAWTVGKPDLDFAARQCAGSRVAPHPQLSGKTSVIRFAPSTLFSGLSLSRLFPVSQT